MMRTISIKLDVSPDNHNALVSLQLIFNGVCSAVSLIAKENRCWNRVDLHHMAYYKIRDDKKNALGSQMTCNAIALVCHSYKALRAKKGDAVPLIEFRPTASIHFDKRTYCFKGDMISLYTLSGRIIVPMQLGDFQRSYIKRGLSKEAELLCRNGQWFFNLVLDIADPKPLQRTNKILGVDVGMNNIAATSSGRLFGGDKLKHERDCFAALRKRLQSNGSKSSKQLLRKISGKEARRIRHENHVISKEIIQEAIATGCDTVAMEDLTNIRTKAKRRKRERARFHGWAFRQLQGFIQYKADGAGINIAFVNPMYTSQTCSTCGNDGTRNKYRLVCKFCGIKRHSDLNASLNIRRIAVSADTATGTVNCPNVATDLKAVEHKP
jgi:putative transposase